MSHIDERLEEFRKWVLKKDKLLLKSTDIYDDKQFKLECKKTNLNCLSEFKKISELIIKLIKHPDMRFIARELDVEYINLYIKIVLDINDFTNLELNSNTCVLELETEYASLLYVVEFKLNTINSEILKRENKNKNKNIQKEVYNNGSIYI